MSAYEVCTAHIDAMLTAGLAMSSGRAPLRWTWRHLPEYTDLSAISLRDLAVMKRSTSQLTLDTATRTGAMLLAENRRSVNHRYAEEEIEEFYQFTQLTGNPDPAIVFKAIHCYQYQACEHDTWQFSEASAFCDSLADRVARSLPGYAQAPWEITSRDVFSVWQSRNQ